MNKNKLKATLFHKSAHLEEDDMLPLSHTCNFCGSTERMSVANIQKNPTVILLQCKKCDASSVSRIPKQEILQKYYSQYYDSFECNKEKITLDAPERMAEHIIKYSFAVLSNVVGRRISILDYGGGDGAISAKIAKIFVDAGAESVVITLVDYNQSTCETGSTRIRFVRCKDLTEISSSTIDLVIASAVLEHIPEPRKIIIDLLAALKKGGVFYARTPYVVPLSRVANLFGINFDFTYPAHLHDLGAKFWNKILDILLLDGQFFISRSAPSIVETTFRQHFFRTLIACILKAPGYLFPKHYGFVGGWEVFITKK